MQRRRAARREQHAIQVGLAGQEPLEPLGEVREASTP